VHGHKSGNRGEFESGIVRGEFGHKSGIAGIPHNQNVGEPHNRTAGELIVSERAGEPRIATAGVHKSTVNRGTRQLRNCKWFT
jgi:hypothetical protein